MDAVPEAQVLRLAAVPVDVEHPGVGECARIPVGGSGIGDDLSSGRNDQPVEFDVDGELRVLVNVRVAIDLPFMLRVMKGTIEGSFGGKDTKRDFEAKRSKD